MHNEKSEQVQIIVRLLTWSATLCFRLWMTSLEVSFGFLCRVATRLKSQN
jgi:hypothetical protein